MSKGKIIFNSSQTSNVILENGYGINITNNLVIDSSVNSVYSDVGSIEVLGGHTLNAINKDIAIEEIIVTNGTINFDNNISFGRISGAATVFGVVGAANVDLAAIDLGLFGKGDVTLHSDINMFSSQNNQDVQQSRFPGTKITIGSQGRLNLTGSELPIEEIIMSDGAQFQCVVNNNQYILDSTKDAKLDSKDLKQLIKVTEFMYDKFGDQKDIIINYDDIADLKIYHKLCNKIGKNSVQNFIESKKALYSGLKNQDKIL